MDWKVEKLTAGNLHNFWTTFKDVLQTQFPGYTKSVIDYFLDKIYSESSFYYYLNKDLKTILVVFSEKKEVVGFAVLDEPYGGVSLCRWLGVKPEYQKQGIGSRLIQEWINTAKDQHCHKVEVAAQPEAKIFYEKMGLELEGTRKKSYFGIDQYIFGKVIGAVTEESLIK